MTILPTSLVGSYPQPGWLIDREALQAHVRTARRLAYRLEYDGYLTQAPGNLRAPFAIGPRGRALGQALLGAAD